MSKKPEKVTLLDKWLESDSPLLRLNIVRRLLDARRKKHIDWMIFDACAVVVLIVLGFSARPAYRAFREYRIDCNFEAAKTASNHGDWGTARDKSRSVLLARGRDFEAYRIWARATCKLGAPCAFLASAEVYSDPRATRADLLEQLEVMVRLAPQVVALSAHASVPEIYRNEADFRAVIVPLLIQRGQSELAENSLREVMGPNDGPKVKLELLRVLCSRPTPGHMAEARQILADMIVAHADEQALAALLILSDAPVGLVEGEPLPDLPKWLENLPQATALHHLLALHPGLRAHPESAPQVYASAIKRFQATDPAVLGTWLVRHDQAEMAAILLEEPAKTSSDAFIARLNALMRLKRDDAIAAALVAPPALVDLVELEIMQATLAASHSNLIASSTAWTRALNHAAYDTTRNRCIELARIAQRCGAKAAAEDAWVAAVRLGWGPLPPYADLLPVYASLLAKGRSEDLMAMLRVLLRFEPRNPELLNNAYFLALFEGVLPPRHVAAVISKLIEREDKPAYNATLMLAVMLDGRPEDALALLPKVNAGRVAAPGMLAALEGTARVLVDDTEAGMALLGEVDWRDFMVQERKVFRKLLVKHENAKLRMPELASPAVDPNPEDVPAWRKAVERFEIARSGDVLPALLAPKIPGASEDTTASHPESSQIRPRRKAKADTQ